MYHAPLVVVSLMVPPLMMIYQGPVSQKRLKSKNLSLKKMLSLENK